MKNVFSKKQGILFLTVGMLIHTTSGVLASDNNSEEYETCGDAYVATSMVGRSGDKMLGTGLFSSLGVFHPFGVSAASSASSMLVRSEREMKKTYELIEQSYVGDGERIREVLEYFDKHAPEKVPSKSRVSKLIRTMNENGELCKPQYKGDPEINGRNLLGLKPLKKWLVKLLK